VSLGGGAVSTAPFLVWLVGGTGPLCIAVCRKTTSSVLIPACAVIFGIWGSLAAYQGPFRRWRGPASYPVASSSAGGQFAGEPTVPTRVGAGQPYLDGNIDKRRMEEASGSVMTNAGEEKTESRDGVDFRHRSRTAVFPFSFRGYFVLRRVREVVQFPLV
jgi:hypothetical protein